MARFLTMQRSIVPIGDRTEFHKRVRDRAAHFKGASCKTWMFEEVGLAGAIIEFVEAEDEQLLRKALKEAPGASDNHPRIYKEMEFRSDAR